jgi:SAM-dependent methyltransferase
MGLWGRRLGLRARRLLRHDVTVARRDFGDACGVLRTDADVQAAVAALRKARLPAHPDAPKNWDALHALATILRRTDRRARVLDAGSGLYGPILQWLGILGYRNLVGCDISFQEDFRVGPIKYRKCSLLETGLPAASLDAITCLSVIEHDGVDPRGYAAEMARLLKPGGVLITSTDYWPDPIDTRGLYPYGKELGEMKVFDRTSLAGLVDEMSANGLRLVAPMDYGATDPVVAWERTGKRFTFALLTAVKTSSGSERTA